VVRLRVVTVDLRHAAGRDVAVEEVARVADGEAEVRQAALVAAPRGVADDDGQDVEAEVVVVGPPHRATEQEPAVAAAEVEDDRGGAAEEGGPVERAVGEALERGLRPALGVEDLPRDGDAELAL